MKVHLKVPMLPNFLFATTDSGFEIGQVSVADVSDDDLRDIGQRWTDALLDHAKRKRAEAPAP